MTLSDWAASVKPPIVSTLEFVITCPFGAASEIVALDAGRALIVMLPPIWVTLMAMSPAGPEFVPAKILCCENPEVRTLIAPPSAPALLSVMLLEPLISPEGPVVMNRGSTEVIDKLAIPALSTPSMMMSPPLPPKPYWLYGEPEEGGTPAPRRMSAEPPVTEAPAMILKSPSETRALSGPVMAFSIWIRFEARKLLTWLGPTFIAA